MSFAQDYGKYSVKHSTSKADLQQYIGQHVQVFKYEGRKDLYAKKGHDEYMFSNKFGGKIGETYRIDKVKSGKQIVFDLSDNSGNKIQAKINANGDHNYIGMRSCNSFFLVDKFEADKDSFIGLTFSNSEGITVAKSVDYVMAAVDNSYPQPRLIVQSEMDGSRVICAKEDAQKIFLPLGRIISNPKVKATFKVVGVNTESQNTYNPTYFRYNFQNTEDPHIVRHGTIISPETTIFEQDLTGHYVSVLSKVEKPSNSAIRYGNTTTVQDKNVTRYSYIDNIIDILILGGSKQFDFVLKNISDNSIKIIWNEAAFIDFDGTTSKIMHSGTKYSQREADQPATTIIKGAKIEDLAAPNCNVRYSEKLKDWIIDPMYPSKPALSPGQLKLMLPIQIRDVINEYIFIFDVNYIYNHPERLNI